MANMTLDTRGAHICSREVKFPGKDSGENDKLGTRDKSPIPGIKKGK